MIKGEEGDTSAPRNPFPHRRKTIRQIGALCHDLPAAFLARKGVGGGSLRE